MLHELYGVLKCGALIGLVPYTRQLQQPSHYSYPRQRQRQQWDRLLQLIYTVLLLGVNSSLTVYGAFIIEFKMMFVSNLVNLLLYVMLGIVTAVILLELAFAHNRHLSLFQQSQRLQRFLQQQLQLPVCGRNYRRRGLRRLFFWHLPLSYGGLLVPLIVRLFWEDTSFLWYPMLSVFIIRGRCFLYIVYLESIEFYQQQLNLKLWGIVNCKVYQRRVCLDVDYKHLESLDILISLKQCYRLIYAYSLTFNHCFGWSLISTLSVHFFGSLVHIYWNFLTLAKLYPSRYLVINSATLLPVTIITFIVGYSSERCKREWRQTIHLVQKLQQTCSRDINANLYSDLVDEFCLQLMQDTIEVQPKGFYKIDLNFLMQVSAALATSVVILMQFSTQS